MLYALRVVTQRPLELSGTEEEMGTESWRNLPSTLLVGKGSAQAAQLQSCALILPGEHSLTQFTLYACIPSNLKLVHLLVSHMQAHSLSFVIITEKMTSKHDNVTQRKQIYHPTTFAP